MEAQTIERKYQLTKIEAGDYLLPSNDGRTVWRIRRYTDGPSGGLEHWPKDREVWGIWGWRGATLELTLDEDKWAYWDGLCDTREEAIQLALKS